MRVWPWGLMVHTYMRSSTRRKVKRNETLLQFAHFSSFPSFLFFFSCFFVFFLSSAPNEMPKIASMVRTVLKGALSRYFAPLQNTEICPHMRGYSKNGMKSTKQLLWDCLPISVVPDGKDGDRLHFEKFSLNFSKFSYPSLKQSQNYTMDYSSWNILTDVLVLNFKAMFSVRVKVRMKDFCIALVGKKQKCRD